MFGGFHVLVGLSIKLQPEKKGTVIWPSFGMFGGSMSSDCFDGFLDQITTGKERYSCLAIDCNVWRLFLRTEGYLRFGGNWLYIIFGRNVLEAAGWVVTARL